MNIVHQLESMGLSLTLDEDDFFVLGGLKSLPVDSRLYAVEVAKAHKPAILEELKRRAEQPDPAALAHARSLLVACPVQGRKLHCWYCSRCSEVRGCMSWRKRRRDVEFFRGSGKPNSLYLVEEAEAKGPLQ